MPSSDTVECPETGKVLSVKGNQIGKHILSIWGIDVDKNWKMDNKDAKRRIQFLLDAQKADGEA